MTVRFMAVDLTTGEARTIDVPAGGYCLIAVTPCYVAHEQHHANGTSVLTIKGRRTPVPLGSTEAPPIHGEVPGA